MDFTSVTKLQIILLTRIRMVAGALWCPSNLVTKHVVLNQRLVACGHEQHPAPWLVSPAKLVAEKGNLAPFWRYDSAKLSQGAWMPSKERTIAIDCKEWKPINGSDQFSNTLKLSHSIEPGVALQSEGRVPAELGSTAVRTAKIRIHPTPEQAKLFSKCAGTHRYFWNKAKAFVDTEYERAKESRIEELEGDLAMGCAHVTAGDEPHRCGLSVKDGEAAEGWSDRYFCAQHAGKGIGIEATHNGHSIWSSITMRNAVLPSDKDLQSDLAWQKEIPFATRDGAIRKFKAAMSSFFKRRQSHPETEPPGFLSKRSSGDSIFTVRANAMKFKDGRLAIFPARLKGSIRVANKDKKRLVKHLSVGKECDLDVARTANGKWYLVLPRKATIEASKPQYGDAFLDPGGRTFQTLYSPDGVCGKVGDEFYMDDSVKGKLLRADALMSVAAKLKDEGHIGRKRKGVLRKAQALRTKVHDVVRDLHRKTCRFLCDNFRAVFIPEFKAPEMTRIGDRTINSKTVRNLMTFAHSEFRNKLIEYGAKRGTRVYIVSEAWTTKTCTGCGHVMDVGSSKTVACEKCGLHLDRDHSGARNIFMRSYQALKA
jgi:transposase